MIMYMFTMYIKKTLLTLKNEQKTDSVQLIRLKLPNEQIEINYSEINPNLFGSVLSVFQIYVRRFNRELAP